MNTTKNLAKMIWQAAVVLAAMFGIGFTIGVAAVGYRLAAFLFPVS